jgi:hypothetical protein
MPAGDQVAMPRWVPTGIHMQHDIIKQKIKHVLDKKLTSTKTKQYISKSYMQIKRAKTVADANQ